MTTLLAVELQVLGPLQVRQGGAPVPIPGTKSRAILTMLGLHCGSVVPAATLIELLWGDDPPRTAAKALQTHISSLRRTLGDGFVLTEGTGWKLAETEVDAARYKSAARLGREAATAGDTRQAVARFDEALTLWRGIPELPDSQRGAAEKTRWTEGHAAIVEDRADALLATGRAAEIIGELEGAVADAPLRERRWGQLMLALYRAGRQGEALGAYQRARSLLANELGVDPGPELRRLEAAIVTQDAALDVAATQNVSAVTRAVTFLLTDIEGSTAAWEADAAAMSAALARHDELIEQVVTSRGGRLIKTRGEGDATFSVFERPSAAAAAAIEIQDAISREPWELQEPMRIRVALHTGEVELRDGDYFGRAVNRAARLRSLAAGGQILCSGATAELVIDSLPDDVVLDDLGMRQLRNLARPEHVFELRMETVDDGPQPKTSDTPLARPSLAPVLVGPGPFVGRGSELQGLLSAWQTALAGATNAALIAGEPGVGKTRLAGEWSRQAYDQGALVIYGRCDEDLGAPYQPFAEALRSLVPCLGANRLRGVRGVEALLPLVPQLTDLLPDLAPPPRADPDTERYALFDAVVGLLRVASASAPVVLILDDLHWAAKPTLLLLRHLLRFGEQARVQIIGTYRSTDLDRSHPLAAMLADLHRDGTAHRIQLSGLDEHDVTAYVAEAGYDDDELARALASVTGGNPFFLIEALRHVDESGGVWDQSTLPQGVREAVSRRLSRLPSQTNKALAAAAVVGSRFAIDLVEEVLDQDLVDAFDEAGQAGIVIEEPGGRYRFNHAIVRQSLLAELTSVRRMRLHQRIATTLENRPAGDDELLAELAYHYFECAWAGNAAKAVEYCRRAADQAMARLAYEGAADLYDHALHALDELDDELPDRLDQTVELLVARCEALLAAGDVASAAGAVSQLQEATVGSARLAAWATCYDGQLSMLSHPERLDEVEAAVGSAAAKLAELDDAAGEAKAHTVRAGCLARLGRIGDCEIALDDGLTAARRAREHRRVNAVLAGAPLAALWGPNPVPRAGGRCLDVVRLLRITTDSPAVEATSTRCQAVLEAFRGRPAAARRMIDSARRAVTELGLRHALLEVEQFAGIVELVADDAATGEPHIRQAYNGFRRMRLDADTAETAALLGRACLALGRYAEADELCRESERLAGHALKASISWRSLRAQLLSGRNEHDEARRWAVAAVGLAERTDLLVDHGDACLTLATVLGAAGDIGGARIAAERAVGLYEEKGAVALAEKARHTLGVELPSTAPAPEAPQVELNTACVRALDQAVAAVNREAWEDLEQLFASNVITESRRKIVGFAPVEVPSHQWLGEMRHYLKLGMVRHSHAVVAVRDERLALTRLKVGTADASPGAPYDEMLQVIRLNDEGRIASQVWFDLEDIDAALAELDAAQARFEEPPPLPALENAASRAEDRLNELFVRRRWDEIGQMFADELRVDDRRKGLRRVSIDRATEVENLREIAAVGAWKITMTPLALRGDRLCLRRALFEGRDAQPEAFRVEALCVVEIDADERVATRVVFDPDDFEAAIAELDTRYLAAEAAPHAHTWSVIAGGYAALNRREEPPTPPNLASIDHRRVAAYAPGELFAYVRARWDIGQQIRTYVERVHRLNDLGAVVTHAARGSSQAGFEVEWREVDILTVDGDMVNRSEVFDEEDIDAAFARFDQLSRPTPRLENAASRVAERLFSWFGTRNWDAITQILADDVFADDRRLAANAGPRHGRDAQIQDLQGLADVGFANLTPTVVATRGERLTLARLRLTGGDPNAFGLEGLHLLEIDTDQRIVAAALYELDDFEAAITELDARYLAGEAAAHSRVWSVVAEGYAALNRHELQGTPDFASIDHRRGRSFEPGEMPAYARATRDLAPHSKIYIEAVHRLSDRGAAVTQASHSTSIEGFAAEWREIAVVMVDDELITRTELFDEEDIDAALARFDQLSPPAPRLENAASRVTERLAASFQARDWDGIAKVLADDISDEDRRRVVNSALLQGKEDVLNNIRVSADIGVMQFAPTIIATRGRRLALTRTRYWGRIQRPDAFLNDVLVLIEIHADERIAALTSFDLDDIDAAFEELDARYLAGEAAAHAHAWSLLTRIQNAYNRHEVTPMTTDDFVNIDHRQGRAFISGDLIPFLHATWSVASNVKGYIENVHRLSGFGAVITEVVTGSSQDGFDFELREIGLFAFEGDLVCRFELFDEVDIDAALTRFDELPSQTRPLENAASKVAERVIAHYAAQDWNSIAEILSDNHYLDDRRQVVNAGVRHGRDAEIANIQAAIDLGATNVTSVVMATRGTRLALARSRFSGRDRRPEALHTEVLNIVEIDEDERVAALVSFDFDDIDAAFAELDARYLAGEASTYSHVWAVIAQTYVEFNRNELPATEWIIIDHRRGRLFASSHQTASIRAIWEQMPDFTICVEAVHQLSDSGAVVTHMASGTSPEGLDAEWRMIQLLTVDGDRVIRCELFDEENLDAALARFKELHPQAPRLENTAVHRFQRYQACFPASDWTAMAELLADDFVTDDRRRVVNAGIRRGRNIHVADMRAAAEVGTEAITSSVVATRGERLILTRMRFRNRGDAPDEFGADIFGVVEIDADDRISAVVSFDLADVDGAFEELDARYLAGEAAAHPDVWSVMARECAAFNSHELGAADWETVDHRHLPIIEATDPQAMHAIWDVTPDLVIRIEAVPRLSSFGAVGIYAAGGTSSEGVGAEWRMILLLTIESDRIIRCEVFDEAALDDALARFDELDRRAQVLVNAATRIWPLICDAFNRRDSEGLLGFGSADVHFEDRRKGLHNVLEGPEQRNAVQITLETAPSSWQMTAEPIAVRGSRLSLMRVSYRDTDYPDEPVAIEVLHVAEVGNDNVLHAVLSFDPDDVNAAFEELDARYLAGEAATHSHA